MFHARFRVFAIQIPTNINIFKDKFFNRCLFEIKIIQNRKLINSLPNANTTTTTPKRGSSKRGTNSSLQTRQLPYELKTLLERKSRGMVSEIVVTDSAATSSTSPILQNSWLSSTKRPPTST